MKPAFETAERDLRALADESPITRGMTIRAQRSHLYLGRPLPPGSFSDEEPDDRVRFTHLKGATFGSAFAGTRGNGRRRPTRARFANSSTSSARPCSTSSQPTFDA